MAKGHDHENVSALKTHLKAVQWKIESEFCVVMGPWMHCKDIRDRALNRMIFQYHPIHVGLLHDQL